MIVFPPGVSEFIKLNNDTKELQISPYGRTPAQTYLASIGVNDLHGGISSITFSVTVLEKSKVRTGSDKNELLTE